MKRVMGELGWIVIVVIIMIGFLTLQIHSLKHVLSKLKRLMFNFKKFV